MVSGRTTQELLAVPTPSKPLTPRNDAEAAGGPVQSPVAFASRLLDQPSISSSSCSGRGRREPAVQVIQVVGVVLRRVLEAGEAAQVILDRSLIEGPARCSG